MNDFKQYEDLLDEVVYAAWQEACTEMEKGNAVSETLEEHIT